MTQLVDVFPIEIDLRQNQLRAFKLAGCASLDQLGGIYAHRVRKLRETPCAWVKDEKLIVTSASFSAEQATALLHELWRNRERDFEQVEQILPVEPWSPSHSAIAQFVAIGILSKVSDGLDRHVKNVQQIRICPEARLKGLVVDGSPALAISIRSVMESASGLNALYRERGDEYLKRINLMIRCKKTTGFWDGVVGRLGDRLGNITRRDKLLGYNPGDYDPSLLQRLPDDHLVVGLRAYNGKVYHYPVGVLKVVITMSSLAEFSDARRALSELRLPPHKRAMYVQDALEAFRAHLREHQPYIKLAEPYTSVRAPHCFAARGNIGFAPRLRFGNGRVVEVTRDSQLLSALMQHGLYKRVLQENKIRFGVIDMIDDAFREDRNRQLTRLKDQLIRLGVSIESINRRQSESIRVQEPIEQRNKLRAAVESLAERDPDLIIIYLPDSERANNDQDSLYNVAKEECIGRGIASQVIFQKTAYNEHADGNILMGILGKTGNIPYVLAEPLEFLDMVVGLDVARQRSNGGSTNVAAMSRIYLNTGELSGYVKGTGLVQGETLPRHVLESLFSRQQFAGKRVAVHRDGPFRGNELQDLQNWSREIGAQFFPVEVIKSGASRMYRQRNGTLNNPDKGDVFYLSQLSAWVVSSLPPSGGITAQPLQINNRSDLTREQAIRSILALTLLHYGSLRPPRLPVSTHASDKIASFLLRSIQPVVQGDKPFWL